MSVLINYLQIREWVALRRIAFVVLLSGHILGCEHSRPVRLDAKDPAFLQKARYLYHRSEIVVRHYFGDRPGGSFVDIGCADYQKENATYFLEKERGWHGVAVDGDPSYGPDYHLYRHNTTFLNFVVTDTVGQRQIIKRGAEQLSFEPDQNTLPDIEDMDTPHYVTTVRLDLVLDYLRKDNKHRLRGLEKRAHHINFVSIAVNGEEQAVLKGFERTLQDDPPDLIRVRREPKSEASVRKFLEERGYNRLTDYEKFDDSDAFYSQRPKFEVLNART